MTTKFILHGGYAGRTNTQNGAFFAEMCKDAPSEVKVLLVYFAKDESEYERMPAYFYSKTELVKYLYFFYSVLFRMRIRVRF